MKFDKAITEYLDKSDLRMVQLDEEGMGPQAAPAPSPQPMGGQDLGAATPGSGMPDEPGPEETTDPLSSEGEVMLVRLLKKALVMKIDDDAILEVNGITDINEQNAKQALETLVDVMNQYSSDIDITI